MRNTTILKVLLGIISFYLIIYISFEIMYPLVNKIITLDFFMGLPEFIGAGTLILMIILFVGSPILIIFWINTKIYDYLDKLSQNAGNKKGGKNV